MTSEKAVAAPVTISAVVLSHDPLVICTAPNDQTPYSSASALSPRLRDREVTYIMINFWTAEGSEHGRGFAAFVKEQQRLYPLHTYIVFVNTAAEAAFFRKRGIKAFFGHQNALVDPRLYRLDEGRTKDLGAVYTAALEDWKRHTLCSKLDSVGLIYWNYGAHSKDYFDSLKRDLPNARFLNEEIHPETSGCLSTADMSDTLNRARVGLCLSKEEGAMFASVEYLLAGLPVVTTASVGGRDFFFDRDYVEYAEATPESVANAVAAVLKRAPSAADIRSRTIAIQQKQIASFIAFLDRLVRKEGGRGFTRADWDALYCDKLIRWRPLDDALAHIGMQARKPDTLRDLVRRTLKRVKRSLRIA